MQRITGEYAKAPDRAAYQATINAALNAQGIPSLPMLASRPDAISAVAAQLGIA
jgi:hypothetical protein